MLGEDGSGVVRLSEIGWLICYCFIRLVGAGGCRRPIPIKCSKKNIKPILIPK